MTAAVIDTHVHFIDPRLMDYPWLEGVLDRPHTPAEYAAAHPDRPEVIVVEAGRRPGQAGDEVAWIRREAAEHAWIRGVVAHADIEDPAAVPFVERCAADPLVVGIRRNLQDEPAGFTASAPIRDGVRLLGRYGLPFDACVRARQLPELAELAAACPGTTIVLDHLGKPAASTRDGLDQWRAAIRLLARRPNVVCKLSGLATEAAPDILRSRLVTALIYALEAFGPERCMYGSDWPILTLATTYDAWIALVRAAIERFAPAAAPAVLAGNASRIYAPAPVP